MRKTIACLFSPFSPELMKEDHSRILILQFFLKELLAAHHALIHDNPFSLILSRSLLHFPYAWAQEAGYLNKAQEHARLLQDGFPDLLKETQQIQMLLNGLISYCSYHYTFTHRQKRTIQKKIHRLYSLTESFIIVFKDNENLIFFLLKSQHFINHLMGKGYLHSFLVMIHKNRLKTLEKKMCDNYHQRGFFSLIPQLKLLFLGLTHQ